MKRLLLALPVSVLLALAALYLGSRETLDGQELYPNAFNIILLIMIIVINAIIFWPKTGIGNSSGGMRFVGQIIMLAIAFFAILSFGWFAVDAYLLNTTSDQVDLFRIMQNSAIIAPILAVIAWMAIKFGGRS